jgi:hypothetical protein
MEVLLQGPTQDEAKCIDTCAVISSTSTWDLMKNIKSAIAMKNIMWRTKAIATTTMAWIVMKLWTNAKNDVLKLTMSVDIDTELKIPLHDKSVIDTKLVHHRHKLMWTTASLYIKSVMERETRTESQVIVRMMMMMRYRGVLLPMVDVLLQMQGVLQIRLTTMRQDAPTPMHMKKGLAQIMMMMTIKHMTATGKEMKSYLEN